MAQARSWRPPTKVQGAVAGALTVFGFAVLHAVWISDIWFNIVPMVVTGAVCGLCIVWSYTQAVERHSPALWFTYNAVCAAALVGLGGASFIVFNPRFALADVIGADDALALLIPPAVPLMVSGTVVATLVLWVLFGRRRAALLPILVAQSLLAFLVGHNLAILGLIELPADQLYRVVTFVGLTVFLAAAFASSVAVATWVRHRLKPPI